MTLAKPLIVAVILWAVAAAAGAPPQAGRPFESDSPFAPVNAIDVHVLASLRAANLQPANLCSDAVFIRRVCLDTIGTLPQPQEVRRFLKDHRAGKRAALVDSLLQREEFADYWSLKWCDVLRVKAEFPINLWPNAVQAYHRWVRDAIAANQPYDQFARSLLTSSGSNFRVPAVNFYRAIQGRQPAAITRAVALTFLGTRLEHWSPQRCRDMESFFSRVAYKTTAEWKEEIVYLDPAPAASMTAVLPDGTPVQIAPGDDPRKVFADWLITPENPFFARCAANRVWAWLLGRGIIHEPDDVRPDNPPVNPELLACLEQELIDADYDLRHLYRLILNSATYQQSSIPRHASPESERLFACYPLRQLDAEVLIDALCWIFGPPEHYSSVIPEPFTFLPPQQRTIALADGSITSPFLEMFGRPPRDTGLISERDNQPSDAQRLHLINSTHIQKKIQASPRLRRLMRTHRGDARGLIRTLYLTILSRHPTPAEMAAALDYYHSDGVKPRQAVDDLAWALINTKEFLYRH